MAKATTFESFIRLNLFVKIDLQTGLDKPFEDPPEPVPKDIQEFFNDRKKLR